MELKILPLAKLNPRKTNPRLHNEEDISAIIASIKEFGFQTPLLVERKTMNIVAGHGRYAAAKQLGLKEVPCVLTDLNGKKADAYVIADNQTAELSTWDWPLLQEEIKALQMDGFNIEALGFPSYQLENIMAANWEVPAIGSLPEPKDKDDVVVFHVKQQEAKTIQKAIEKMRQEKKKKNLSDGLALEYICDNYLRD